MNYKTTKDLKDIARKREIIRIYNREIEEIMENCKCHDFISDIQCTMAFDHTPMYVCVVCDKQRDKALTVKEKFKILKEEFGEFYTDAQLKGYALEGGLNSCGFNS